MTQLIEHLSKRITVIVFLTVMSGCASFQFTDVFHGYNRQMEPVKVAQRQGRFVEAQSLLGERASNNNGYILNLLERGRLQFLAADWKASLNTFTLAYDKLEEQRNKAKIQISKGVETLGAMISSDNAISYKVPYYEQGMLHSYQALNYLFLNDISSALVEVRRANLVQEEALSAYEKEIDAAKNELNTLGMNSNSLGKTYPSMSNFIGKVKNGFQNAFTFYLSGILYEASGELNSAYIDYKRAIEIYPENLYLQHDVLRLAKKLGMQDDLEGFQQRFGNYQTPQVTDQGQVVVLVEQDIVNSKQDIGLNLPVARSNFGLKFFSFSVPVYQGMLAKHNQATFKIAGQTYQSSEIVRIQSLAAKDLQDQLPALLTRQVVRVVAKEQLRQKLSREGGDLGNIMASIYNIASEKADTRSWSTLPDQVDMVRIDVPAGKHVLQLQIAGKPQSIELNVQPNRITLVNFTAMGNYTNYQVTNL